MISDEELDGKKAQLAELCMKEQILQKMLAETQHEVEALQEEIVKINMGHYFVSTLGALSEKRALTPDECKKIVKDANSDLFLFQGRRNQT